jgi:hypothetical protein
VHRIEIFDEAKPPTPDTVTDMGGLCPYGFPLKPLEFAFSMAFLLGV